MEYWVDGVLKHSLHNEVLISLGTRHDDKAVDAPWKYTVQVSDAVVSAPLDDRDVSAIYDTTGLLLILGEPGSGKTTTLLGLARTLLDRAKHDLRERVPIVLNLSSFNKKQPLSEWISGELSEKYRVPPKIARFWLQQHYLLPFLDGLDEVELSMQPDCAAAINEFIEAFDPPGLIVCCRLNEYQGLPKRLKLNGAIRLEPLSEHEIAKYLASGGAELTVLRDAVNTDPVLQELSQTPLMLSIMSLAFHGAKKDALASDKGSAPEERRNQIFGLYVEKMFQLKGTASLPFPKEKIIGWLSWLARNMREHSQSVFLVEGLQPSWLPKRAERVLYGTFVALSFALLFALTSGLTIGLSDGFIAGLGSGLIVLSAFVLGIALGCWSDSPLYNGILAGPIVGLVIWLLSGLSSPFGGSMVLAVVVGVITCVGIGSLRQIVPVETINWKWGQFTRRFHDGFTVGSNRGAILGMFFGVYIGVSGWFEYETALKHGNDVLHLGKVPPSLTLFLFYFFSGLYFSTDGWLVGGLFGGIICGLVGGFIDIGKEDKVFPNQGINLSRENSLTTFFVVWLILGLVFCSADIGTELFKRMATVGRVYMLVHELILALIPWIILALLFALIVGLNRGGSAVIKHYSLRLILWRKGYTPLQFIIFLNHCARLVLLKKVGGGYIFIHGMLRDYFAELRPTPPNT
jgi:hypothetical protein